MGFFYYLFLTVKLLFHFQALDKKVDAQQQPALAPHLEIGFVVPSSHTFPLGKVIMTTVITYYPQALVHLIPSWLLWACCYAHKPVQQADDLKPPFLMH